MYELETEIIVQGSTHGANRACSQSKADESESYPAFWSGEEIKYKSQPILVVGQVGFWCL